MNARITSGTFKAIGRSAHDETSVGQRTGASSVRSDHLFVQAILCPTRPGLVGRTWSCPVETARANQIEFRCGTPLPEGTLVDTWVDLADRPARFFLSGHVSSNTACGHEFGVVITLAEGAATDYRAWQTLIAG